MRSIHTAGGMGSWLWAGWHSAVKGGSMQLRVSGRGVAVVVTGSVVG